MEHFDTTFFCEDGIVLEFELGPKYSGIYVRSPNAPRRQLVLYIPRDIDPRRVEAAVDAFMEEFGKAEAKLELVA